MCFRRPPLGASLPPAFTVEITQLWTGGFRLAASSDLLRKGFPTPPIPHLCTAGEANPPETMSRITQTPAPEKDVNVAE